MSCIHHNFQGKCELFNEAVEMNGCDAIGTCICDDDPEPSEMCEDFESLSACENCGVDLDVCECPEEEDCF